MRSWRSLRERGEEEQHGEDERERERMLARGECDEQTERREHRVDRVDGQQ